METQVDILKERLFGKTGMGAKNFSFFPGSNPRATPEDIAREINRTLDEIGKGNFKENLDLEN